MPSAAGLQVLFAPAAAAEIGGGHLLRDLALAESLEARGATCTFAVSPWGAERLSRFADRRPEIARLARSGDVAALRALVDERRPTVLVLDDYALDASRTAALQRPWLRTVVVDDLADRPYACDLLVDPGYGRRRTDYASLTPAGCEVLTGSRFALVRAAFRQGAPPRRRTDEPVRRVFVSLGLSDVGAIAARVVQRLRPLAAAARFDVALGSDASSVAPLQLQAQADPALAVHADARNVADLMGVADIAVGAGGVGTWERCALGLPTLAVIVADNQRPLVKRLAEEGALLACDAASPSFEAELEAGFSTLLQPEARRRLAVASAAFCDGRGAERVAEAVVRLAASS